MSRVFYDEVAMQTLFQRLLGRPDRDGKAEALEPRIAAAAPAPADAPGATRRDRGLGVPGDLIDRSLSQKVLHGWLQNRHQVLVPLTLRLGLLEPGDVALLVRFVAAAALAAAAEDAFDRARVEGWLRGIGADAPALATFEAALRAPPALNAVVEGVRDRHLEAFAYAAMVATADLRLPAGQLFVDFLAARLGLSAEVVRSINRRHRR